MKKIITVVWLLLYSTYGLANQAETHFACLVWDDKTFQAKESEYKTIYLERVNLGANLLLTKKDNSAKLLRFNLTGLSAEHKDGGNILEFEGTDDGRPILLGFAKVKTGEYVVGVASRKLTLLLNCVNISSAVTK